MTTSILVGEVCERLGVSRNTIKNWLKILHVGHQRDNEGRVIVDIVGVMGLEYVKKQRALGARLAEIEPEVNSLFGNNEVVSSSQSVAIHQEPMLQMPAPQAQEQFNKLLEMHDKLISCHEEALKQLGALAARCDHLERENRRLAFETPPRGTA